MRVCVCVYVPYVWQTLVYSLFIGILFFILTKRNIFKQLFQIYLGKIEYY